MHLPWPNALEGKKKSVHFVLIVHFIKKNQYNSVLFVHFSDWTSHSVFNPCSPFFFYQIIWLYYFFPPLKTVTTVSSRHLKKKWHQSKLEKLYVEWPLNYFLKLKPFSILQLLFLTAWCFSCHSDVLIFFSFLKLLSNLIKS